MRKKEYIHTHALLMAVSRYLVATDTMPAEALAAYEALETTPASFHKSKQHHHDAIWTLTAAIEPCLTEAPSEGAERPVTR